ncbi:MAG TPA: LPP20 family lipoprotein [Gammaproteobacteria bacterium]|nr:LPP20 family lipoprotein [Gammaproteobacteria bacterium]
MRCIKAKARSGILLAVVLSLLAGCAGTGGRPRWADGQAKEYPEARFMTATGSADSQEKAKDRALSNLAKIFEVQIEESAHDESSAWTQTAGEERKQGNAQLAARYLDAYTSKLLEGARIAESWRDDKAGLYYSLAVLERGPVSNRISSDIRKQDQQTQALVGQAQSSGDPLRAARLLFQARTAQLAREDLQRDLRMVDASGLGIRPVWTVQQLDNDIDQQLKRMKVDVRALLEPGTGPVPDLGKYLQAGVAAAGMTPARVDAAYRLEGDLDVQDLGQKDGWYWFRGSLEIILRDNRNDKLLVDDRWPLKVSGATKPQAEVRLRDQVQQRLNLELKTTLLGIKEQQ